MPFLSVSRAKPGLGPILGAALFVIVLVVGLGRLAVVGRTEARAAETALVQRVDRGRADVAASLSDDRARLLTNARAATDTPGLAAAVALRDTGKTLPLLQEERRNGSAPELAAVDNTGRLLAAAPATNLPLGTTPPVRQALGGHAAVGTIESSGQIVVVAAAPVLQEDVTVGAMIAVGRLDDAALNLATRDSGLTAAVLSQGRLVAATTALRNRYNAARDKTIHLTPPASASGLGRLVVGGTPYDVSSQSFAAELDPGRDLTLVVGRPTSDAVSPTRGLDLASALGAAVLAGLVGWLLGRRIGRSVLALGAGEARAGTLAGAEVRAVAARLADERATSRAREARADSEAARLRSILDAVDEGIIVSDRERRVILTNQAARVLLGLNGSGEPGAVISFLPPADGAAEIRTNQRVLRSYSAPIAAPEPATSGAGVVTVLHDATAEREGERLRGEFLSTVSHELQTPLTAITGAADLLLDEPGGLTAEQTRFLTAIQRNANRLVALVSDLLDVSRLETGRVELDLQPVDLATVIRSTIRTMASLFEAKGQTVLVDAAASGVPPVLGDRRRLEQVLANLLGNASQYTQSSGRVRVGLRRVDDEVVLTVTDDGPGIGAADLPHVFEKFYRGSSAANRRERGSGLGLAIARSIVDLHGGRVWVESGGPSGPEPGTRFSVALSIAPEEE